MAGPLVATLLAIACLAPGSSGVGRSAAVAVDSATSSFPLYSPVGFFSPEREAPPLRDSFASEAYECEVEEELDDDGEPSSPGLVPSDLALVTGGPARFSSLLSHLRADGQHATQQFQALRC